MVKRPPNEQSQKAADSLQDLRRQIENGSTRMMSAEKKLRRLKPSCGGNISKNAEQITNSVEQVSTARERLLAELANLTNAHESGKEQDIENRKKRVQQNHKVLADAVKRLDRSMKSRVRERAPSGGTGGEDQPDVEELQREILEAVLRELELLERRRRTDDPPLW
jgi:hypothetical protein